MLLFIVHARRLADTLFYPKSRRGMISIASKTNKVVSSKQTLEQTLEEFYSRCRLAHSVVLATCGSATLMRQQSYIRSTDKPLVEQHLLPVAQ